MIHNIKINDTLSHYTNTGLDSKRGFEYVLDKFLETGTAFDNVFFNVISESL